MTGSMLLRERALPLMGERAEMAAEYEEFCPAILNLLLLDVFEINENLRLRKGKKPLEALGSVASLEDEIPVEAELMGALAYGLAARLTLDEGDMNKTGFLEHGYVQRLNDLNGSCYTDLSGERV